MSQLTMETRQSEPAKNLVKRFPVKEGKKLQNMIKCIICTNPKTTYILDENKDPLVLRCIKCGHKSWYKISTCA